MEHSSVDWSGVVTAFATVGLFGIAVWALDVAVRQLRTVDDERTVRLIEESSSPQSVSIVGFLDFAADKRVSRLALSKLYRRLIKARPMSMREKRVPNLDEASDITSRLMLLDLNPPEKDAEVGLDDAGMEEILRERVLCATNYFERISTLVQSESVNSELLFQHECYDIVVSYYVLEEILYDLCKHEGFDFEDFRYLAAQAQAYLPGWIAKDDPLRTKVFQLLASRMKKG